jgi:uncharacterized membrane protein YdjX (TVP38/TMEM64 family)
LEGDKGGRGEENLTHLLWRIILGTRQSPFFPFSIQNNVGKKPKEDIKETKVK